MPLVRRIPKRGFHNHFALEVAVVNVGDLETRFEAGEEVNARHAQGHEAWSRASTTCSRSWATAS